MAAMSGMRSTCCMRRRSLFPPLCCPRTRLVMYWSNRQSENLHNGIALRLRPPELQRQSVLLKVRFQEVLDVLGEQFSGDDGLSKRWFQYSWSNVHSNVRLYKMQEEQAREHFIDSQHMYCSRISNIFNIPESCCFQ